MMNKNKYKIIALYGKSGAGKDSIQRYLVSHIENAHGIISCTTRPPREKEKDGVDYYFISKAAFEEKVLLGDMLEQASFRNWWYGTPISSLNITKINIGVFNLTGLHTLLKDERLEVLPVEIYVGDDVERICRCLEREKNPDCKEICRRFLTDEEDFKDINFFSLKYDNVKNKSFENLIELLNQTNFLEGKMQ